MGDSLNITISNGSLHLSDLHVTDSSGLNNTTIESISFYIPQDDSDIDPFNVNVESIPYSGEVHDIDVTFDNGNQVHGYIEGDIPFTATLQGINTPMTIDELNNSFSNISFTRDKTDNESEISFSVEPSTDESTGGKKKRSTKKRKGKKKRTTKKRKGKKKRTTKSKKNKSKKKQNK